MATFYRTTTLWVVDYRYRGQLRRWFKGFAAGDDAQGHITQHLRELYGNDVQMVEVRPATAEEELQYLRGEAPKNVMCPTGRGR